MAGAWAVAKDRVAFAVCALMCARVRKGPWACTVIVLYTLCTTANERMFGPRVIGRGGTFELSVRPAEPTRPPTGWRRHVPRGVTGAD